MDFGFSARDLAFRTEVRSVVDSGEVRAEIARLSANVTGEPDERPLYGLLGKAGLLGVSWPKKYGGGGRSPVAATIVIEELGRAGVPDTLFVNSIQTVGQLLLLAGSPARRARLLPALARGELFASVLYTEPATGSDLAAVRTTAERVDGGFRLTGTKAFNLKTTITDVGLCAARTDHDTSRYGGLTLFVVDLRAPGVRVRQVPTLQDEQFCIVTLEDVEVADDDVVGGVGDGWATLMRALPLERTGFDFAARARRWYELAETAAEPDPERAGRYAAMVEAAGLLAWQAALTADTASVDPVPGSVAKWYTSELAARIADWSVRRHGPAAPAAVHRAYREAPGLLLAGGTSEMMLQTLAEQLPELDSVN